MYTNTDSKKRPAPPTGNLNLGRLIVSAFPEFYEILKRDRNVFEIVSELTHNPQSDIGKFFVEHRDDRPLGIAVYYPEVEHSGRSLRSLTAFEQGRGFSTETREKLVELKMAMSPIPQGSVYLARLAVDPQFQRRGIGSRLLRNVEDAASAQGFQLVSLHVLNTNVNGIKFYEGCGYSPSSEVLPQHRYPVWVKRLRG